MPGNLYSDAYAAFVDALKAARLEQGVTQAELATRLGQPQSFISKSERRERRIDVVEFLQISDALGLDAGKLLGSIRQAIALAAKGSG